MGTAVVDECSCSATDVPTPAPTPSPTADPTPPPADSYYLACGSSARACAGQAVGAAADETHELRCCSDSNPGSGWKRHNRCDWAIWAKSKVLGTCHHGVTFDE